ncbi:MAG TPA: glycosyltransferase 87 family protein, partial [Candidatus Dormibacteraeota bacterium]|nr:glycosyltransferase 87 family protein [Candidatus Dormibacteraeota bacterium]
AGQQCDEYPVLTMYLMRLTAWLGRGFFAFFYWNAALLGVCALVTAWALHRLAGDRALYFALAPSLAIYAFVNWDLLAVALATVATLAYLRNRDGASGALLGLGTAAKLYPAVLLVPFVLGRVRERRTCGAASLMVWAVIAYATVNLPFALVARHQWATFFRFNADRLADWDSMWFVACDRIQGQSTCGWSAHFINAVSVAAFAILATVLWWVRRSRQPDFPRWTFGFPLLVAFLLTNKVYSPQYGLWLLPWFALALPNPWLFAAFEATDVAVFVTRFSWFGRLSGFHGMPIGAFQVAVVARAVVLVVCLGVWAFGRQTERSPAGAPLLEPSLSGAEP